MPEPAQPLTLRQTTRRGLPYLLTVVLIHALALALWAPAALHAPLLWGVGVTAYLFGLRHAWDADHIAVIDNTVRKLLTLGRRAHGVGFYFSVGHAAVVLLMAVAAALIGSALLDRQDDLGRAGGWVAPLVAGGYLIAVALVNLTAAARLLRTGATPHAHTHGLLARVIAPLTRLVGREWQVLPLGFLMGLGFDTASEVALLALTGDAAQHGLTWSAVLSLPLLFAAGMTLLDTLDGVCMTHAYAWALDNPQARRTYNLLVTGLSGVIALVIGAASLGQWAARHFAAPRGAWLQSLDVSSLGFWLAGGTLLLFLIAARAHRTPTPAPFAPPLQPYELDGPDYADVHPHRRP